MSERMLKRFSAVWSERPTLQGRHVAVHLADANGMPACNSPVKEEWLKRDTIRVTQITCRTCAKRINPKTKKVATISQARGGGSVRVHIEKNGKAFCGAPITGDTVYRAKRDPSKVSCRRCRQHLIDERKRRDLPEPKGAITRSQLRQERERSVCRQQKKQKAREKAYRATRSSEVEVFDGRGRPRSFHRLKKTEFDKDYLPPQSVI